MAKKEKKNKKLKIVSHENKISQFPPSPVVVDHFLKNRRTLFGEIFFLRNCLRCFRTKLSVTERIVSYLYIISEIKFCANGFVDDTDDGQSFHFGKNLLCVAKTNPPKNRQKLLRPKAEKWHPHQKLLRPEAEKSAKNKSSKKLPKIAKTRSWKMALAPKIAKTRS